MMHKDRPHEPVSRCKKLCTPPSDAGTADEPFLRDPRSLHIWLPCAGFPVALMTFQVKEALEKECQMAKDSVEKCRSID
jgi:hypothetical protein